MKSVTEFPQFKLEQGLKTKNELSAAGKTNEEISASIGETFKYEGDKLKHFMAAMDVATANAENLARVLVVSLNEGENAPHKAVKVEEHYYVPEFKTAPKAVVVKEAGKPGESRDGRGKGGGGKGRSENKGPKPSPWGISPEEKAAKKAASLKAQKEAKAAAQS